MFKNRLFSPFFEKNNYVQISFSLSDFRKTCLCTFVSFFNNFFSNINSKGPPLKPLASSRNSTNFDASNGYYCGRTTSPPRFTTTGSVLTIIFHGGSNDKQYEGFTFKWQNTGTVNFSKQTFESELAETNYTFVLHMQF